MGKTCHMPVCLLTHNHVPLGEKFLLCRAMLWEYGFGKRHMSVWYGTHDHVPYPKNAQPCA